MRMLKDKKGISLIALVVSVIILIIIAGVSARLLIGNDGVLQNASDLNDSYKLTIINERLDYIALSKRTYNPNKTLKVDEYIQSLENQNDFDLTDVQKVDDSKAYIVIDNSYEYYVEIVDKKIKVTYLGSAKDLSPRIVDHNVVYTTHSIKVSVEAWRAKTYKFYISDTEGEDGTLGNENNGECLFDGLTENKKYYLKIVVENGNGSAEKELEVVTKAMPAVGVASISPTGWTNQTITITLPEEAGLTTRYTLDGTTPTKSSTAYNSSNKPTTNENCSVKYIYTDGVNITSAGSITIANYDNLQPNTFTPTATSTTNSIVVTAVATDHAATSTSGQSNGIEYAFKLNNGEYTAYQTSGEYTFDSLTQTTDYTITVKAKDAAGNVREGSVSKGTGTIPTVGEASISPTGWTNGNVTVTLPKETNYTTRYTLDGTTPTKTSTQYSAPFTVTGNCSIKFIYTDGTNINTASSISVANIDKLAPNAFTPSATSTTRSVTVTASATDQAETATNGKSDGITYAFKLNNGSYTSYQENGTYTFDNLTQTTNYTVTVSAKDAAGNITEGSVSKGTGTIPTVGEASISPTGWTNQTITITLPEEAGFTTRYTLDGTTPTKDSTAYNSSSKPTTNANCTVKWIYTDGTNITTAGARTIANYDNLAPNEFTPTGNSVTTNSVTISASTTDATATEVSGQSNGIKYRFSKNNGSSYTDWQDSGEYTFTGLTQNQEYIFKVQATDAAGNIREGSSSVTKTTGEVTISQGNITFTLEPNRWTNGSIKVTANTTVEGFIVKISSNTSFTNPIDGATGITVSENGTVYARLEDSTGQANGYASTQIAKIDKTKPVVTNTTTATTNTITIKATDEASGIIGYAVTTTIEEPTTFTACENTKNLNVNVGNKTQGIDYYVWVKDEAGNVSVGYKVTTQAVTQSTGNITFALEPNTWTNGNVTVTASTTTGYNVKMSSTNTFTNPVDGAIGITVSENGTVYARLEDSTGQANGYASIDVDTIDKQAPTYTSVEVKNVTTTGYDVYVYGVTDNGGSGINRVQFPTWTDANGQDDLQSNWQTNSSATGVKQADGTTWVYRVNVTDHKNEAGKYFTHIYIYDNVGIGTWADTVSSGNIVPSVTITYNYNGAKNYFTLAGSWTKNNFSGIGNDCVVFTSSINLDGLELNDTVQISFDYNYSNLTKMDDKNYYMVPQIYGTKNYYNVGYQGNKFYPIGTGNSTCSFKRVLRSTDVSEVTFHSDIRTDYYTGGSITFSNFKVTKVNETTVEKGYNSALGTLPTLTPETGYIFDGWYTQATGGTKITESTPTPAANTTYYAHWIALTPYTITNLVQNGSFENIGWTNCQYDNNTKYVGDYSCYLEGTKENSESITFTSDKIHLIQNHKYYVSVYSKSSNSIWTSVEMFWPGWVAEGSFYLDNKTSTSWTRHSTIISRNVETGDYNFRIDLNNNKCEGYINYDGLILIDLTEAFGEGNEPSKEWCDENIDYFDGTTVVYK